MKKALKIFAVLFALVLSLSACGPKSPAVSTDNAKPAENAKTVTNNFMKAVASCDTATIGNIVSTNDTNSEVVSALKDETNKNIKTILLSKMKYTIDSVKEVGNSATANITIEIPDYTETGKAYAKSAMQYLTDQIKSGQDALDKAAITEKMTSSLQDSINNADLQAVKTSAELKLQLQDNKWVVVPDQTFFNQITGHFFESATGSDLQQDYDKLAQDLIDSYKK